MDWSVFSLLQKPAYQALLFLVLTPVLIFIIRPKSANKAWTIAVYTFILFLLVNAIMLWFTDSPWGYFFYSIGFSVAYVLIIAIIMHSVIRILKLTSAEESAMAFLIVIYQPVVLLLVMLVKWITAWI